MKYVFNDQVDEFLMRFYATYSLTRDTEDYVSSGTHKFVYKFLDKTFKKTAVSVYKDVKKRLKQYKKLARKSGLTLSQYLETISDEEENLQSKPEEIINEDIVSESAENLPTEPEISATDEQPTEQQESSQDKPENEQNTDETTATEELPKKPKRECKKAEIQAESSDQGAGTALSAQN